MSAVLAVSLGVCMASLDTAIANTALPTMAHDLLTSESRSVWVVSSYQLAMVCALLPAASLGEIIGHRRIAMGGLILFTIASLACGLAPSLEWLVVARVLQGLGAAGIMGVNGALLRFIYPAHSLGKGMGVNAIVVGLSFAAGPTAASIILSMASWHWLFLVNVPIGILACVLGRGSLPVTLRSKRAFDSISAMLCAGFLAMVVYTLNEAAHTSNWTTVFIDIAITLALLLILLKRQAGDPAPLLAIDLLRKPIFALSAATAICTFSTQALAFIALPFMFQSMYGYTQVETGFLITPWPVMVAAFAPIAGRLSDKYQAGWLSGLGLGVLALGMALLATMPEHPTVFDISWRMAICGAGFGFFQSPNVRTLMSSAPPGRSGGASGMVGTVRLLGQSIGAALVAACFNISTIDGAVLAIWLGAGFACLASVASFSRLKFSDAQGTMNKTL